MSFTIIREFGIAAFQQAIDIECLDSKNYTLKHYSENKVDGLESTLITGVFEKRNLEWDNWLITLDNEDNVVRYNLDKFTEITMTEEYLILSNYGTDKIEIKKTDIDGECLILFNEMGYNEKY